jgi:hypothetical protein
MDSFWIAFRPREPSRYPSGHGFQPLTLTGSI